MPARGIPQINCYQHLVSNIQRRAKPQRSSDQVPAISLEKSSSSGRVLEGVSYGSTMPFKHPKIYSNGDILNSVKKGSMLPFAALCTNDGYAGRVQLVSATL